MKRASTGVRKTISKHSSSAVYVGFAAVYVGFGVKLWAVGRISRMFPRCVPEFFICFFLFFLQTVRE